MLVEINEQWKHSILKTNNDLTLSNTRSSALHYTWGHSMDLLTCARS